MTHNFCLPTLSVSLQIKPLEGEKETLMNANRGLAEENISYEPKIIELKARIHELSDDGKKLLSEVQDKINDYSEYYSANFENVDFGTSVRLFCNLLTGSC